MKTKKNKLYRFKILEQEPLYEHYTITNGKTHILQMLSYYLNKIKLGD